MIISHRLKYVFIHIPKTGGTSIKHILTTSEKFKFDESGWSLGNEHNLKKYDNVCDLFCHASISETHKYLLSKHYNPKEYFTFAFIRNPWDMIVSYYEYYKQYMSQLKGLKDTDKNRVQASQKSFDDFFDILCIKQKATAKWINNRILINDYNALDFVGKFEIIQEDFNTIAQKILGKDYQTIEVPHENKTKRKPYQQYYNETQKQWIEENFAKIIEMGKYKF